MVELALTKNAFSCACDIQFEFDWIINEETVVRPDSMVYCGNLTTDFLTSPPTLILEVASQATFLKDRNIKLKLYEANNVKYYLIANPDKKNP
jgi:Uma2 family endonuclease